MPVVNGWTGHLASTGDAKNRSVGTLNRSNMGVMDGFGSRNDGGRTHDDDDDVVSCNPMDGMNSSVLSPKSFNDVSF